MFELYPYQIWIIIIASIIFLISAVAATMVEGRDNLFIFYVSCFVVGAVDYFGSSVYAMVIFTHKMYALSRMRAISINKNNHTENSIEFNEQQRELLYATAKYVTLLSLALISSWLTWIIFAINIVIFGDLALVSGNVGMIDVTVNVICLYLQFPFASDYYNKCCICFSDCCLCLLTKQANARLQKSKSIAIHVLDTSATIEEKGKDTPTRSIPQKVYSESENMELKEEDDKLCEMVDAAKNDTVNNVENRHYRQSTVESTAL